MMHTSIYTVNSTSCNSYTRDSTFIYLGGLVTPQEYAEYDRVVSQLYLSTIAKGNLSFSESDSITLYNIASLCPALGGKAAYKARSIVYAYHPNAISTMTPYVPFMVFNIVNLINQLQIFKIRLY